MYMDVYNAAYISIYTVKAAQAANMVMYTANAVYVAQSLRILLSLQSQLVRTRNDTCSRYAHSRICARSGSIASLSWGSAPLEAPVMDGMGIPVYNSTVQWGVQHLNLKGWTIAITLNPRIQ